MSDKKVPLRSEVKEEFTWNLKDIFESDEKWFEEYEALKAVPEELASYSGKISKSAENLLAYLKREDEIRLRLESLHGYASRRGDEDTGNNFYQDMRGKATSVYVAGYARKGDKRLCRNLKCLGFRRTGDNVYPRRGV